MSRHPDPSLFAVDRAVVGQAARHAHVAADVLLGGVLMAATLVAAAVARASAHRALTRELLHLAGDSAVSRAMWDGETSGSSAQLPPPLVDRLLVTALGASADALPDALGRATGLPAAGARAATDIAAGVVLWGLAQSVRVDDHALAPWFVRTSEAAARRLPPALVSFLDRAAPAVPVGKW